MRRYKITSEVLEYLLFTIVPILLMSFIISVLFIHYTGTQAPMLTLVAGTTLLIMTAKNLYNLYIWVKPKLKS